MFNDKYRITAVNDPLQNRNQTVHIVRMQTGRRFVKDIDGLAGCLLLQFGSQFDTLRLTAGKRRGGLAELDIAKTDIIQRLQLVFDLRMISKDYRASSAGISSTS